MKIIVCIKQVPDTNEIKLDPKTNTLIREGVPSIINPDDRSGIEAALRLKEMVGGTVTLLCMGPAQADVALREGIAMGADDGILLSDRAFGGADTWATSSTLAAALKKMGFDIIVTGRQAIDGDTAQVGPQIAEHLGIPQVSYVKDIQIDDGKLVVERQFEDRSHIIEIGTPCLLTILSEYVKPRYTNVWDIADAYKDGKVSIWNLENIRDTVEPANLGLKGSPTKVVKSFTKSAKGEGETFKELSEDEAVTLIINKMKEKYII